MNSQEFQRLLSFQHARKHQFRPAKILPTKFAMKRLSRKPQGRVLVDVEKLFLRSKNSF